ncbi:Uncharacterized [Syntrophomonas zehnderi OL-4]|uniref:Uncharacterized n=1 Tax=Syntrophomonas zehnderi OL-4 TaxID=690567 RepID=A0A0E4G9D3_9FIRM|nr:DUF6470 family protein [Syntrophomonas zehnderi]CFX12499.1 Uncharacterized [Syntrophomonas zehnderi OL-4]
MLQIRIDQQFAQLGLDIKKPAINLQTTLPAIELQIEEPRLEIHSPRPRLYIDQSQCFADMDKRSPAEFSRYYADLARQKGIEAIGIISSEGDYLANWQEGNTIEALAASAMDTQVDFNVTAVPQQPPRIDWEIRPVETNVSRGTIDLKLRRGQVQNNFQWGRVNAYIAQQNYLKISWHNPKLNQTV